MKTKVFTVVLGVILMVTGIVLADVSLYMEYITMLGVMICSSIFMAKPKRKFHIVKGS
ncbi:hypothetical protein KY305_19350 [Bacillus sp. YC2]|uniref:hypothetical protein n=1 Tax=Bacillus sp. YC2 TaxID=2861287 RepID=UPI001CA7ADAA|nr:hypothetical protein [Bacillus sp. YC2]MBY8914876.1 hypothetical protein [Bacillus sp. YC2]